MNFHMPLLFNAVSPVYYSWPPRLKSRTCLLKFWSSRMLSYAPATFCEPFLYSCLVPYLCFGPSPRLKSWNSSLFTDTFGQSAVWYTGCNLVIHAMYVGHYCYNINFSAVFHGPKLVSYKAGCK